MFPYANSASQWCNCVGVLGAIAPPSAKNLPILKEQKGLFIVFLILTLPNCKKSYYVSTYRSKKLLKEFIANHSKTRIVQSRFKWQRFAFVTSFHFYLDQLIWFLVLFCKLVKMREPGLLDHCIQFRILKTLLHVDCKFIQNYT